MDHPTKFKNMFGNNSEADRLLNLVQEWDAGESQVPFESLEMEYGTTEGTVCQGNDSRLANARTPTTHAATHKSAGSDVLKIDELAAGTDVTTLDASITAHGLCPKLSNASNEFLNGVGAFAVPLALGTTAGTACDGADSRLSDTRDPKAHATSHKSGGTDAIKIDELGEGTDITTLNATTLVHGLLPKLSGVATEFLNGSGGYTVPAVSSVVGVAYGSATVLATTTSIEVTHGLTGTPTVVILSAASTPKGKYFWWDTPTATTFVIHIDSADATDPISFSWCAKV